MKITLTGELKTIMSNRGSLHNYFGWPTAVRLRNGKIAVAASGFRLYHVCPFGKTVIAYSEDDGESFTAPAAVLDTALDDRDGGLCTFGKSGLIVTSFNNTVKFQRDSNALRAESPTKSYIEAYLDTVPKDAEDRDLGLTYRVSCDNGVTFGRVMKSPITSPHGPIELKDGTILYVGTSHNNGFSIHAYKMNLSDGSFEHLSEINTDAIKDRSLTPCEPYAIELDDGRILCHIRVQRYGTDPILTIYQCESADGGKSWSIPVQIIGDKEGAPPHILKHSSGALISTYGRREMTFGIKAMISTDGGRNWSESEYLYKNETSADLGYPSTVELSDGSLFTVFYAYPDGGRSAEILGQKWTFSD